MAMTSKRLRKIPISLQAKSTADIKARLKTGKSRASAARPLGVSVRLALRARASAAIKGKDKDKGGRVVKAAVAKMVGATLHESNANRVTSANLAHNAIAATRAITAITAIHACSRGRRAAMMRMMSSANAVSATKARLRPRPAASAFSPVATKCPKSSKRNAAVQAQVVVNAAAVAKAA